jgi:hypothetical protein
VVFRTNSGIESQRAVSLPIGGLAAVGELHASAKHLQFGRVVVGARRERSVVLTNLGTDVTRFDAFVVNGSQDFSIRLRGQDPRQTPSVSKDPDGDGEPGLVPYGQLEVIVVFQPSADRPTDGELHVISDAHNEKIVIALTGNAAGPCVRVVPRAVAFPPTAIGATRVVPVRIESCGSAPVTIEAIRLSPESAAFGLGPHPALPIRLPGANAGGAVGPGVDTSVTFAPGAEAEFSGRLLVTSTDPDTPELEIELTGRGVENACPTPRLEVQRLEVRPLDVITLDGSASTDPDGPDGRPVEYAWTVVSRPGGSTSQPVERLHDAFAPAEGGTPDRTATPEARFFVDLAGEYVLELAVVDHYGARAPSDLCPSAPARLHLKAVPSEKLHIQLTWDTPADRDQTDDLGTDVDLHLLHPQASGWFSGDGLDCFFENGTPDWGRPGDPSDDPTLDIDDVNGAGPENINIARPQSTEAYRRGYRVGVHYYSADGLGAGADLGPLESVATVRIFVNGEMAYEGSRALAETRDFWTAAEVKFVGANGRVIEVDTLTREGP